MFKSEGTFDVVITRAVLTEAKFQPGALDVALEIRGVGGEAEGCIDYWRGEWSTRPGKGNAANRQQWELTMQTLKKVGFAGNNLLDRNAQGQWLHIVPDAEGYASIPELVGKRTTATIKQTVTEEGKIFYNVRYLGDGGSVHGISMQQLAAMLAPAAAQPVQPAPAQPPMQPGLTVPAQPAPANGPFANLQRQ